MPTRPPDWHTAQLRIWLDDQPATRAWIRGYPTTELRMMALRLCAANTTSELLGVNFMLVDWRRLAAELGDEGDSKGS